MKVEDLYNFCGKKWSNVAELTGYSINTPANWRKSGGIPLSTQKKIERLTHGQLIARVEDTAGWGKGKE